MESAKATRESDTWFAMLYADTCMRKNTNRVMSFHARYSYLDVIRCSIGCISSKFNKMCNGFKSTMKNMEMLHPSRPFIKYMPPNNRLSPDQNTGQKITMTVMASTMPLLYNAHDARTYSLGLFNYGV
jgi:hypothetical protein